jgi:hypothetical protein
MIPVVSEHVFLGIKVAYRKRARSEVMIRFQTGDEVRVTGLAASEWQGEAGVVVKTYERAGDDGPAQECAVKFQSCQRWFMSAQLARAVPDRTRRFFRGEALHRWSDLSPDEVLTLTGKREELIQFLQERFGFGLKKATSEADSFICDIEARIRSAVTSSGSLSSASNPLKLSA